MTDALQTPPVDHKTQVRFTREPSALRIDGRLIRFDVTKFNVKEAQRFNAAWHAAHDRPSQTFTSRRNPGAEMAKRPIARPRTKEEVAAAVVLAELRADASWPDSPSKKQKLEVLEQLVPPVAQSEVFVISAQEIRAIRLAEMTSELRERQRRMEAEEVDRLAEFIFDTISNHVHAQPSQLYVDGREVTAGKDVVEMFAGRPDVLEGLKQLPLLANFLQASNAPPEGEAVVQTSTEGLEKNELRSPSGTAGSSDSDQATPQTAGSEPAPTAASAAPKESAAHAPATA